MEFMRSKLTVKPVTLLMKGAGFAGWVRIKVLGNCFLASCLFWFMAQWYLDACNGLSVGAARTEKIYRTYVRLLILFWFVFEYAWHLLTVILCLMLGLDIDQPLAPQAHESRTLNLRKSGDCGNIYAQFITGVCWISPILINGRVAPLCGEQPRLKLVWFSPTHDFLLGSFAGYLFQLLLSTFQTCAGVPIWQPTFFLVVDFLSLEYIFYCSHPCNFFAIRIVFVKSVTLFRIVASMDYIFI